MHAAKPAYDKLIFELSAPGRFAYSLPESDVPDSDPAALLPKAPERVVKRLLKDRILAGVPLKVFDRGAKNALLVAVTERRTKDEIDAYAAALAAAVA